MLTISIYNWFIIYFFIIGPQSLELKEFYTRAATDIIASTAFGLKVDSLKDEQNIFYRMGQKLTGENFKAIIKIFAYLLIPRVMKVNQMTLLILSSHNDKELTAIDIVIYAFLNKLWYLLCLCVIAITNY